MAAADVEMMVEEQLPNAALAAAASFLDRNSEGKKFYGMDAELVQKEAFKWDPDLELKAVKWLEKLTGESMADGFWESLKSGILLCKTINAIRPNTIDPKKIGTRVNAMVERANIQLYLDACTKLGLDKSDLFLPSDLNERKYLSAVLQNILALATMVENRPGYYGPSLFGGAATAGGPAPLHRRSRSFGGALKPWDFDQQMKETANRVAEEKRVAEEGAAVPALAPATRQAIATAPSQTAAPRTEVAPASVPSGPRKKTEERYIFKLLKALVPITRSDNYDLEADMRVLKQQRIKNLDHLLILLGHKDYWAKLDLSLVTKCCVEEALTNPHVRAFGTAKEKVKAVKGVIERGEVLVPNSDDLIADLEVQEAEAAHAQAVAAEMPVREEEQKSMKKEKKDEKEKERVIAEPPKKPITKMHIPIELVTSPNPANSAAPPATSSASAAFAPVQVPVASSKAAATPEKKKKGGDAPTPAKAKASPATSSSSFASTNNKSRTLLLLIPLCVFLLLLFTVAAVCGLLIFAPHAPITRQVRSTLGPIVGTDLLRRVQALGG